MYEKKKNGKIKRSAVYFFLVEIALTEFDWFKSPK